MYESPQLQFVGQAKVVVKGVAFASGDFMSQSEESPVEYSEDE